MRVCIFLPRVLLLDPLQVFLHRERGTKTTTTIGLCILRPSRLGRVVVAAAMLLHRPIINGEE